MKWRAMSALAVLALAPLAALAQQQEGLIAGKVTTDAGAPIAGAQVYLEKMNLGTTTKEDGSYRFTIPAARATGQKAQLSVKLIGFKPKSVLISLKAEEQTVDFVLGAQAVVLQQVVVTGEGILTTNEKLGQTVNIVHGTQVVTANESNLTNALSAKAPNVQIQSQSGDPGSSTSIQIRGLKSFSGTGQPLFVVDGVPMDNTTQPIDGPVYGGGAGEHAPVTPNRISDVNPNDIESVTILKGAAAAAIYGARASQGVVIITTKSGKPGTTRYTLTTTYSANDVTQGYPLQTDYEQGELDTLGVPQPGYCSTLDCYAARHTWGPLLAPGTRTYSHFDEMFVTGSVWDNVLGISGGDDRRSFYFSAGYTGNQGFVVGSKNNYDRVTMRLKGSQLMGDRMKVGVNLNYVNTTGNFVQRGDNVDGIMLGGMRTPPEFNNQYYLDSASGLQRSYRFPHPSSGSLTLSRGFDNPFWVATSMPATSALSRVYGNLDFNWDPNEWLKLQWTPGLDYYTDQRLQAFPFTNSGNSVGQVDRADFNSLIISSVVTLVGNHTFSPDLQGSVTLGSDLYSSDYKTNFVRGVGLVSSQPYAISNTISFNPNDDETFVHNQSFFGQVTGDLYDQLYLTAAIRNDGFSSFAQNNPRTWYPKASAAWTFTKMVDAGSWLQYGKVRVAYGETGKPPATYSTIPTYQVNSFYEYGNLGYLKTTYIGQGGLTSTTGLGTDSLRAERQHETEVGLDAGFFNGRVDLGLTYYDSRANDIIIDLPLPPSSGALSEPVNAASITNKGVEVTLNLNSPSSSKNISWTVGLIWAQNRNQTVNIKGATEQQLANQIESTVARPGYVTGSIEGYDFIRCGRGTLIGTNNIDTDAGICLGKPAGALYIAANGFPILDFNTLQILGSYQPNWQGGFHASVTAMQKLQLSVLLDVRSGGQAWNGTRGALYVYGTHKDTDIRGTMQTFGSAAWHPGPVVGPGAGIPVLIDGNWFQNDGGAFGGNSGDFVENSGFTKLREIALQYTWDDPWVTRTLNLSSVVFRVSGRNLYTWTKYSGLDPETNLEGANTLAQGVDWFNNPQNRSLVFSIGLNK